MFLGKSSSFRRIYEEPILRSQLPGATEEEKELGPARANELMQTTSPFILRRTQDVIQSYLPGKVECVVFCRPQPLQLALYQNMLETSMVRACLSSYLSTDANCHLACILARKLCNHPLLVASQEFADKDEDTLDILEDICMQKGYPFLRLDGSTSSTQRLELVERFNSPHSNCFVFLLSCKAGGVGLNLVGASRIVLYDVDWNPANDLQAMARVWRDGQSRHVSIYRLLTTRFIINLRLKQPTSVNVRQAAEMLTGAWWNVKTSTIRNCWRKAGLIKAPAQVEDNLEEDHSNPGDLWTEVEELLPDVSSFDDYVESDSAALTSADMTTEEIVNSVHDVSSDDDDDDDPKEEDSVSPNTEEDEPYRTRYSFSTALQGTIEEKIFQRQVTKQELSGAVLDSKKDGKRAKFSLEDLKDLFTLDEETTSSTHRLLGCRCDSVEDTDGDFSDSHSRAEVVAETSGAPKRSSQLGSATTPSIIGQKLGMSDLLRWEHIPAPIGKHFSQVGALEAADG
ncbi:hypothetical protein HPB51_027261 [Rhipicephalus microplus]|uniref:DNA repair and recombination protein RAD54-like n=1 Tax=Rhipicephalus microplus TaxID=6941 RepID=A0A9J6D120_RHIMP|nr:hypothetical protein HPB51_027261 [Rhipicephalus microplus]